MKFPYGIFDFHQIVTEDYFYLDRTASIPAIEDAGKQLLFLRPRRFGKSLLLSTLENYYDLAKAGEFDRLFGHLAIGGNPTPKHNQYFVLKWDFSAVDPSGDAEQVRRALHEYINDQVERFNGYYRNWLPHTIEVNANNALSSFERLLNAVQLTPYRLYLLVDEYDNFANEILMGGRDAGRQRYEGLLRGEGALEAVFKVVKAAAGKGLDRVFITGVAPLVLNDVSSGYNVSENISLDPRFHDLCGFTEAEISQAVAEVSAGCGLQPEEAEKALTQMRLYYNGYCFSETPANPIYNPTLALYFLKHFQGHCQFPSTMLDDNLAMDRGKLSYIAAVPGGAGVIEDALQGDVNLSASDLSSRFGMEDVITLQKGAPFMAALLYYFGVLTLAGRGELGKLRLRVPNLVIRGLYVERMRALLLPDAADRSEAQRRAEAFYLSGDLRPVCDFIEQRYFKVFSNRDYRHANELTIKTAFLTLLFNDELYITDSETDLGRRYADLTMIVRPDARQYRIFDLLIEFKFVALSDAGLSGEEARGMSREELAALPAVRRKLDEARAQAPAYGRELAARYKMELRPRTFAVVAIGFDRLVWEEIRDTAASQ